MPRPAIESARSLSGRQLEAIASLERRVVDHDGGRLKLEWSVLRERPGDEAQDLLVWDDETLVGFCGIYAFAGEPELAGAVDPAHRRRGIGSCLLEQAASLVAARGYPGVLLVTPRTLDAGRRFAERHGARFHHAEHHMVLDGPPVGPPPARPSTDGLKIRQATRADATAVATILAEAFGRDAASAAETGPHDLSLVLERDATVVGALRLSTDGDVAGIYGLAVSADLRGAGIGRAALYEVCLEARRRGARAVTLEVEVDNDHALGLYTSVGFERRTTEDYFRLAL